MLSVLRNASASFHRVVEDILATVGLQSSLDYVEDLVVFSKYVVDHIGQV